MDQACPIDDLGLNIRRVVRVNQACPIDDLGLNIKGSDVWIALALVARF